MQNIISMKIDLKKESYQNNVAQQNDDMVLDINIYGDGDIISLEGATAQLSYINANNTIATISGSEVVVSGNNVKITCPRDCTRSAGIAKMKLVIISASKQVSTFPIEITVVPDVVQGQEVSGNVATVIEKLINENIICNDTLVRLQNWVATHGDIVDLDSRVDTLELDNTQDAKIIQGTDYLDINAEIMLYTSEGYKIKFKRMTYDLTGTILIPSDADIDGNGCTWRRKVDDIARGVFDIAQNIDETNGNVNIRIANVTIDGNRQADQLVNTIDNHRFSGLKLTKVTGESFISNVTVINTVNGEDLQTTPAGGIFFVDCKDIRCSNLNGWYNLGTAIIIRFSSNITIDGSLTYDNEGSGISGRGCPNCKYLNIVTFNNKFSNLSVNGVDSIVDNVISYKAGYSGVNIGHPDKDATTKYYANAHGTVLSNIISFDNTYEGLTIGGSDNVSCTNVIVYGNAINTTRENIRIHGNSNSSKLINITSRDCATSGIRYYSGTNHVLDNSEFYNCKCGVYCGPDTSVTIGGNMKIHNNSLDGIILASAIKCTVACEVYSNGEYGIWISGGSKHRIVGADIHDNILKDIYETGSPVDLYYDIGNKGITYLSNGVVQVTCIKSVTDEVNTPVFRVQLPDHGRLSVDFAITTFYPASVSAICHMVKGVAVASATGGGVINSQTTVFGTATAVSAGLSQVITPSLVKDETNDYIEFIVNQNNETVDAAGTINITATITYAIGSNVVRPTVTLL